MDGPMFVVEPTADIAGMVAALDDLRQSQVPFATVVALTRTAWQVGAAEKDEMRRVFVDPVDFTTEAIEIDQATKANPTARVYFKGQNERVSAGNYLKPQVEGGPRRHTPFEGTLIFAGVMRRTQFAVPLVGAERDGRGNLNPGQIAKIMADVRANPYAIKSANYRNKGVRRNESYFVPPPGSSLLPGIYMRRGSRGILPVFAFTLAIPTYNRIYPFDDVAQRIVDDVFEVNFWQALDDAVRNSNHRSKWTRRN